MTPQSDTQKELREKLKLYTCVCEIRNCYACSPVISRPCNCRIDQILDLFRKVGHECVYTTKPKSKVPNDFVFGMNLVIEKTHKNIEEKFR